MASLVFFHAHPDDEAIATGGTMAMAADAGHRVVLVCATRGERGEVAEGYLRPDQERWQRRVEETQAAAEALGVSRVEFLPYADSGMIGTPENDDPGCFWQADVEEAARHLAAILQEEKADILTVYDENGVYGHPDHIQVHRVGMRAAELAGTSRVYMNTVDNEFAQSLMAEAAANGLDLPGDLDIEALNLGVSGERITTSVDVRTHLDRKRQAMAAHASQISETSFFLSLPPVLFEHAFGTESYIRVGAEHGTNETDLFAGLDA